MTTRSFLRLAALAGFLLGTPAGVGAVGSDLSGELKEAQAALAAGDYPKAYQAYLDHGDGNPLAQFTLGLFHQFGWGRPVDPVAACRWQEKAARGDIPAAQAAYADCLRKGINRPADPAGAAHWYEAAALSGILTAPCALAELYMAGEGVARDPRKALDLCREPAEKGFPPAQLRLGRFYLEGDASIRDPAAGLRWIRLAAQGNDAEAQYRYGLMLRDGKPADARAARWWLETAASQGWLPAYLPSAEMYFNAPVDPDTGMLAAADLAKAYLWSAAASRRLADSTEAEPARALLARVVAVMPATWRPDLDRQVADHLARFATPR